MRTLWNARLLRLFTALCLAPVTVVPLACQVEGAPKAEEAGVAARSDANLVEELLSRRGTEQIDAFGFHYAAPSWIPAGIEQSVAAQSGQAFEPVVLPAMPGASRVVPVLFVPTDARMRDNEAALVYHERALESIFNTAQQWYRDEITRHTGQVETFDLGRIERVSGTRPQSAYWCAASTRCDTKVVAKQVAAELQQRGVPFLARQRLVFVVAIGGGTTATYFESPEGARGVVVGDVLMQLATDDARRGRAGSEAMRIVAHMMGHLLGLDESQSGSVMDPNGAVGGSATRAQALLAPAGSGGPGESLSQEEAELLASEGSAGAGTMALGNHRIGDGAALLWSAAMGNRGTLALWKQSDITDTNLSTCGQEQGRHNTIGVGFIGFDGQDRWSRQLAPTPSWPADTGTYGDIGPAVAYDEADASFRVVFQRRIDGQDNLLSVRVAEDGSGVSDPVPLLDPGSQTSLPGLDRKVSLSLARNTADGSYVLTYAGTSCWVHDGEALARSVRLTPDGETVAAVHAISQDEQAVNVALAFDMQRQRYLAVWSRSLPSSSSATEVVGRLLDPNGAPMGEPRVLRPSPSSGWAVNPFVAFDADHGRYLVTMSETGVDAQQQTHDWDATAVVVDAETLGIVRDGIVVTTGPSAYFASSAHVPGRQQYVAAVPDDLGPERVQCTSPRNSTQVVPHSRAGT
ncbi:MAG: hypothetical protein ACOC1F_08095, partial [Myxococcota bacterium]